MSITTKIQGGYVVAFNGEHHELLEDGCVVYQGDTILFVGFPDDPQCPAAERTHYAPGKLISPGLINLHCIANIDLQPLRIDTAKVGYPKSKAWFDSGEHIFSEAEFITSAKLSVAALLRHGSTTFCNVTTMASKRFDDPEIEPRALADASQALGARAYLAHNFQDHSRYNPVDDNNQRLFDPEAGQTGLARAVRLVEELKALEDPRIKGFMFPYTTDTCSDELLQAGVSAARELDVPLRSHFAQYPSEASDSLAQRGMSPVERLAELGALGEDMTLTHAIYLRDVAEAPEKVAADLKLLADTGTHVAHCPVVFVRRGVILHSFDRYLDAGVNIALGTDTVPPDLIAEMRAASQLAKIAEQNPEAGSAARVFNAATLGGAKALGRDDLGKLAAGAQADIAIFNLRALHIGVVDDPIKALIHYSNGVDTDRVIVAGQSVVEDGRVIGLAEDDLLQDAQQAWQAYKQGLVARDPLKRSEETLYPTAFPIKRSQQGGKA